MKKIKWSIIALILFFLPGCEDIDIQLATEAGVEAITAVTLSEEAVQELAKEAAFHMDREHVVAPVKSEYARRLKRLVGEQQIMDGTTFNYKVYQDDTVNAFAMADGTIRIYSGLMNLLDDEEFMFVIGHEMGHIVKDHMRQKMKVAYTASAIRKGIASYESSLGDIARTQLGGFVEKLLGAQFSQLEEKIADDYGLKFLLKNELNPDSAIRALRKLETLGSQHSFLSSHPDPGKRADRLERQLKGEAQPVEEEVKGFVDKVLLVIQRVLQSIMDFFKN